MEEEDLSAAPEALCSVDILAPDEALAPVEILDCVEVEALCSVETRPEDTPGRV